MDIRYLKHIEISKLKWDRCISQSFNGIVYAYSWYLDIVSYEWEALVMGDYEAVMPLPAKTNYAINRINQPEYAPQLGVFTSKRLDSKLVDSFLKEIPRKFGKVILCLNAFNKSSSNAFRQKILMLHELDLIEPYERIFLKFSNEAKSAIKNSKKKKVSIVKGLNLKEFLLLKKENAENPLTFDQLNILRRVIPFCMNHNIGNTYGAYNDKNELVSGAFFMKSHQKAICLVAACSQEGKEISADYALFNYYIKENAGKSLTFDFGNAEINEIENLSNSFNAQSVSYIKLKRIRKYWFGSLLKK